MLITISGLYGSGGQELGVALADALGYPLYDRELIRDAVDDTDLDMEQATLWYYEEDLEQGRQEKKKGGFSRAVLSLQMDVLPIAMTCRSQPRRYESGLLAQHMSTLPLNRDLTDAVVVEQEDRIEALRRAQIRVTEQAAARGSGIFLGRCASQILAGREDCLHLFTRASLDSCRVRISALYGLDDAQAADELIRRTNERRAIYFEAFTGKRWDSPENYDYCINTDYLGMDGSLELIRSIIKEKG